MDDLILWDTFNDNQPFTREDGYHQFNYTPDVGPDALVRYWQPGLADHGATAPSHLTFDPAGGYFGGAASYNYSGT